MKRAAALGALLLAGSLALAFTQGQPQQTAEIKQVKGNLYMVTGGGGNTAVLVGENGVVVVDTKNPKWGQPILDKIRTVTDKPVTTIINTHTHGDHVSGNVEFPATVQVVAHENCKASMEKMPIFASAEAKRFLPGKTYKDKLTLFGGKNRVDLYYLGRGHTNGDTIVVFPALRLAHTGDLFARKALPLIDQNAGGSGVEYPATVIAAGRKIRGVDTVIPGHSDVTDWKSFQEFGEFMKQFVDAVRASHKQGKSAEEAAAAVKMPERFKDYGMQRLKEDVTTIYAELGK